MMLRCKFALTLVAILLAAAPASAQVRKLFGGFVYTEGPVADADGNLYFVDVKDRGGKIYRLDATGRLCVFAEHTGGANGLKINGQGEIVACCQAAGRIVAYNPDGCSCRVLTAGFCGRRTMRPRR